MYAVLSRRKVVDAPPAHLETDEGEDDKKAQKPVRSLSQQSQMYIQHIE